MFCSQLQNIYFIFVILHLLPYVHETVSRHEASRY